MSKEQVPRTFKEPKSEKGPESKIILAEGVPSPVSASPSFENTQVFFSALSFPIDGKNPPRPFGYKKIGRQTHEEWSRNWEILGWHLGTNLVLEETGNKYRIKRERIRQITEELVSQSCESAPVALKDAFPKTNLSTKKPNSLHKAMRLSEAKGGKMREVIEAVSSGKSYREICEETGASGVMLLYYRKRGIAVPYFMETNGKEYRENLRLLAGGLLDDRQILKIFEDIEKHGRLQVCNTLKKAGILVALGKAARSEGVFVHKSEPAAYRLLKELGIPVLCIDCPFTDKNGVRKTRNYFFVINNHEKTREAFTHPSFDAFRTNPVEVLGKVPEEIPTTNIMWDHAYISVGKFLRKKGISIEREEVEKYLGSDCPVSVFYINRKRSRGGYSLVRKQDADILAAYFEAKLAS